MEETRTRLGVALWVYVIMPEHVHILLFPTAGTPMRRILASLKRGVSDRAKDHLTRTGQREWLERLTVRYPSRTVFRFWQPGGGHDHNIWKDRTLHEVVEYIHANPVRRGLVESPHDWPWSSAAFWAGESDFPIAMDPIDV
jgi:putative transposase